jgi:tetratricopeptide (TPR) repeat protein
LTLTAYSRANHLQFLPLDDQGYLYGNTHVKQGLTAAGVAWALTTGDQANWHPLTWVSHMLDVQAFGLDPGYHHVTNVAIHAVNVLLLFLLLAWTTGSVGRSAFVAALFGVHPLHVESVAWVAERKDVLSAFFWFLTMTTYMWYARAPSRWRMVVTVTAFAFGLMAKPMLVTLPFALLLFDAWPLGRLPPAVVFRGRTETERQAHKAALEALVREKAPLFVLAACSSVITLAVQARGGAVRSTGFLTIGARLGNALTAYTSYLAKTAWPSGLAVFYPLNRSMPLWQPLAAFCFLAAVTWWVFRVRRQRPYLMVGWFWYLGTLVPVIGVVQVGMQSMADRYTYVPLIGVFVMAAWGVPDLFSRLPARRIALPVAAAGIALACAVATRAQVAHWQDAWTLWTHTLAVTHDNEPAEIAVGSMLGIQGRPAEAVGHLEEALRIAPDSVRAHAALGRAFVDLGRYQDAFDHLDYAVRHGGSSADTDDDLGVALAGLGRPVEAMQRYDEALRVDPARPATHKHLGIALMMTGRVEAAISHYLGFALMTENQYDEAKREFGQALQLRPDMAAAHDNLGFVFGAEGRFNEALAHLTKAVRLQPRFEMARVHLGIALAATGRLEEAKREFQEVLRLNPNNTDAKRLLDKAARRSPTGR